MDAPIGHLNPKGEAWQSRARLLEENQIEMPPFGCLNLILCQGLLDLKKIEVCEVYPSWKTKTLIFEHQTQSKIGNSPQFSERHLFSDWVCRIRHPHVTQKRRGDSETTMEVKNMPYSFCRKIIVLERNFGLGWYHMTPKLALWLSQHKPFCKKKNVDVHHLRGRPFRALAMSATSSAVSWIPLVIKASSVSGQT
jgi:hypothetical protein